MGPDVHLKRSQADILLVTVLAAERFPRLGITVQLLVFGQPRESRIGLVAQTALELFSLDCVRV